MRFAEVIGQEEIKHQLLQSVAENRIAHAQMFYGPRGVGKLQLALAYAQYLACQNPTAEDSCGVCPACLQYQKLQHPDLHLVFPIVKNDKSDICDTYINQFRELCIRKKYFQLDDWYAALGSENKQGLIYENESSEILRKLSLKSFGNGYRVVIIWLPEKMNEVSANKMLKILEEPPEKTLFLLVSEQPERLLPTILSRVQQRHVPRLTDRQVVEALLGSYPNLTVSDADSIAHIANGSYLAATQIIDEDNDNNVYLEYFESLMNNAIAIGQDRTKYEALIHLRTWSDKMAALTREQQKNMLAYAQRLLREFFVSHYAISKLNYLYPKEQVLAQRLARYISTNNVELLMNKFDSAQRQIEQNGNSRIVFFDLALQIIVYLKKA